jgi:hypothetical protein
MEQIGQFFCRHDFTSVKTAATRAAASRGASALAAVAMAAKVLGDSSKEITRRDRLSPVASGSASNFAAPARVKISAFNLW